MIEDQEPKRLSEAALDALPKSVRVPGYDRSAVGVGSVHLGVGGFHRSHQLVYTEETLAREGGDWACCGVGLMPGDRAMADALQEQDYLYTLVARSAGGDEARVIAAMKDYLWSCDDPRKAIDRMTDPAIRIVSLTVTEKGYCQDQDGDLDLQHPMVVNDLRHIDRPQSALGLIVSALSQRRERELVPFTVMSCDNLPGNGDMTRHLVLQLAGEVGGGLQGWIEDNTAFPNSMVDRITPATRDSDRQMVAERFGISDRWPVICEEFQQWVIEDNFCNGRPAWEAGGAQFVQNVHPYEKMKVRLLNGSHSALSYPAYLMGHREVDAAMNDPLITNFVREYMDEEITETLSPVPGIDLENYKATLIRRFSNPAIKDQVQRLAEDGSRKIPNAILPCIRERLARDQPVRLTALAIACWIRYMAGEDEKGDPITITDPLANLLMEKARQGREDPKPFLGVEKVFDEELGNNTRFVSEVGKALESLYRLGTGQTLRRWLDQGAG